MQLWGLHQTLEFIAMPCRQEGKQVHVFETAHIALNRWRADLQIVGDICIDHKPGGLDRAGLHQPVDVLQTIGVQDFLDVSGQQGLDIIVRPGPPPRCRFAGQHFWIAAFKDALFNVFCCIRSEWEALVRHLEEGIENITLPSCDFALGKGKQRFYGHAACEGFRNGWDGQNIG